MNIKVLIFCLVLLPLTYFGLYYSWRQTDQASYENIEETKMINDHNGLDFEPGFMVSVNTPYEEFKYYFFCPLLSIEEIYRSGE